MNIGHALTDKKVLGLLFRFSHIITKVDFLKKNLWERLTENCLAQRFFWYDFNTSGAHRAIKSHIMRNLKNVSSSWGFLKDVCSELFPLPTFFKLLNAGQILNAGKHLSSFFFQLNEYL